MFQLRTTRPCSS